MAEVKTLKNYVNGEWVTPKSSETAPVYNPATGEVIAHVPISSSEDVDNAVELANQAYKEWKEVPVPKRARLMFKLQNILVDHWDELSESITMENGKELKVESEEVVRRIGRVESVAGAPSLMMGDSLPSIATALEPGYYRYPVGVIGRLIQFNFPVMVPCRIFTMEIVIGNIVVMKPSDRT